MSENAVFNEVLSIGIDTSQFNAQIEAAVAKYNAAMASMSSAGNGVGNFGAAADQIKSLSAAADEGTGSLGAFGTALENAAIRVPARMLVFLALGAALASIAEPIRLVAEGFSDLENSSGGGGFRDTVEGLDQIKVRLLEITASPLFDFAGDELGGLKTWLEKNRVYLENFAQAFGKVLRDLVAGLAGLGKALIDTGVFGTLLKMGTGVAFVLGNAVISLKELIGLMNAGSTNRGFVGNVEDMVKNPTKFIEKTFDDLGRPDSAKAHTIRDNKAEVMRQAAEERKQLNDDLNSMLDAINGNANEKIAKVSAPSTDSSADVLKQFRDEQDKKKEILEDSVGKNNEALHSGQKNLKDVTALNVEAIHSEMAAVHDLIKEYEAKGVAVIEASNKSVEAKKAAIAALHAQFDKVGHDSDRSGNKAIESGTFRLEDEQRKNSDDDVKQALTRNNMVNELLEKQNKDAYDQGKKTIEDYYTEKHRLEDEDLVRSIEVLGKQRDSYAVGSEEYRKYVNILSAIGKKYGEDRINDVAINKPDAETKRNEALVQSAKSLGDATAAQYELAAKTAEEADDRQKSLEYLQKSLAVKRQIAEDEMKAANAQLQNTAPGTTLHAQAMVRVANAQTALTTNQLATATNAGDQAAADNPLMGHTAALQAEITALSNMKDKTQAASDMLADLQSSGHRFAAGLADVNQIMGAVKNGVSDYISGAGRGHSALGGAGAVLSDSSITGKDGLVTGLAEKLPGMLGDTMGKMVPMIGPLIGTMFSTVSQLLSAGVQKMVDAINLKIENIQNSVSSGQIGIGQEITELQQVKQQAISELGGSKKKGAQDQLNAILKSLNAQIGALLFQQQQVIQNFNNMTKAGGLDTLSGTFASWYQTWDGINSQVKAYVDAGGSIATANQYLNQQLEIQRQTLTTQLAQGDQQALNDAIALNQLLTQRSEIMKEEAKTEFGIINSDSIERRTSAAVQAGSQLQQQRYNFNQQMLQMNAQITLDQERLSIEGKIFDVAGTLQQLQAKSNVDNIAALNIQLAQYRDMQAILASTSGLRFGGPISNSPTANLPIPGEPSVAGPINFAAGSIVVTGKLSKQEASDIGVEIGKGIRSGRTSMGIAA